MREFSIKPTDKSLERDLQEKIDQKTKPVKSLGNLEDLALQIGMIQHELAPKINHPTVVVFAGDHGIALEGVSPYPQEVTHQMVLNFLHDGAAINVFAKQNGLSLKVVDAGVNYDFGSHLKLANYKVNTGTKSFLTGDAMLRIELSECILKGAAVVNDLFEKGCNCTAFGEMGIGNTSSAAMLMHYFTNVNLEDCVGRGTGLDAKGLSKKLETLKAAIEFHGEIKDWEKIMMAFSGYEIAMMTGAMLQAAENKMIILLDGFIATTAYLAASKKYPEIEDYVIACHLSDEKGHLKLLDYLGLTPILNLGMRLGEGTGAAMAFPIIRAAVGFLNDMASFESAGVSNKE